MNTFTVSLFGHREINNLRRLKECLSPIIKVLIQRNPYVSFLIGRNGEFDEIAASIIKAVQKEIGNESSEMNLVLPYRVSNLIYYEKYYDNVILPESLCTPHPKAAITLKNRWMIERSDLVLVYVERESGGAYKALKYAISLHKNSINLCTGVTYSFPNIK